MARCRKSREGKGRGFAPAPHWGRRPQTLCHVRMGESNLANDCFDRTDMAFRFAIGSPNSGRSLSWKFWSQGDEAYLVVRGVGARFQKFSFHKTGNCRWARIQAGLSGSDRVMFEWQRDVVPARGMGQASLLMAIAFPTNHLSTSIEMTGKEVTWIPPATANKATLVEIFITREFKQEIVEDFSQKNERSLLFFKTNRSGLNVCVARSEFDCGPVDMKVEESGLPGAFSGVLYFPDVDTHNSGRPLRLVMMPQNSSPPTVWELGGHDASAAA